MSNFILLHVKNQLFQDHLLKRLLFSCWMFWYYPTSLVAQMVKHLTTMQETRIQSLGWEHLWRRKWQPTPVFLLGKYHGQKSLVDYSPWGCKESDTTERLHFHLPLLKINWAQMYVFISGLSVLFFLVYMSILLLVPHHFDYVAL